MIPPLSPTQRNALLTIDAKNTLFKRPRGWGYQGSDMVGHRTIEMLVKHRLVRTWETTRKGFTFQVAGLTDLGQVAGDRLRNQERAA